MSKKRLTREEMKQQTRKQLLEVATRLFASKGYYETSVDKVAEEAGFSKGAVYSNFGSKEDLFLAVFTESQQEDLATLAELATQFSSLDAFVAAISKHHERERKQNEPWTLLKLEFLLFALREDQARDKLLAIMEQNRKQLAQIIAQIDKDPLRQKEYDYERLAFSLLTFDIGIGIQATLDEASVPNGMYEEILQKLFQLDERE
ncbi:MAG TPA: helix-turn-helix domain-containing protein [Pseudogracilibacillus sp.]|nr:helix-turn-helix domain-containing protein [Pseudogracilibacillus sp.]